MVDLTDQALKSPSHTLATAGRGYLTARKLGEQSPCLVVTTQQQATLNMGARTPEILPSLPQVVSGPAGPSCCP